MTYRTVVRLWGSKAEPRWAAASQRAPYVAVVARGPMMWDDWIERWFPEWKQR